VEQRLADTSAFCVASDVADDIWAPIL
jgi:hypothetical protein